MAVTADISTFQKAVARADKLSRANDKEYFVVCESGEFDVVDSFDLNTFYNGIRPENVSYSTVDGFYS